MSPEPTTAELLTMVADLSARVRRLEGSSATVATPLRCAPKQAAIILGVSVRIVYRHASRGLLVRLPKPKGAVKCTRTFFHPDNVTALAQSEDAAREWIARRKYVAISKRAAR